MLGGLGLGLGRVLAVVVRPVLAHCGRGRRRRWRDVLALVGPAFAGVVVGRGRDRGAVAGPGWRLVGDARHALTVGLARRRRAGPGRERHRRGGRRVLDRDRRGLVGGRRGRRGRVVGGDRRGRRRFPERWV